MSLLNQLVRELLLSEAHNKSPKFRWKFDPTVFEEPYEAAKWQKMWTGVEFFYGQPFIITCTVRMGYHRDVTVKISALHYDNPTQIYADVTHTVDSQPSDEQIRRLSSADADLRADIEHGFAEMDWTDRIEAHEKFEAELPPWRPGVWSVPGVGTFKGDRLDMGLFQVVIPLDLKKVQHAYLIARPNFASAGSSPRSWMWPIYGHYIPQLARVEVTKWIRDNVDLDNHDPDYLAKIFNDCKTGGPLG